LAEKILKVEKGTSVRAEDLDIMPEIVAMTKIIAKEQGVALKADEAILDKTSQTIKLHDNVKIIKDGAEMSGEYLLIDLNEQNILMDNPTLEAYSFKISAQEGYLIANDLQMINGTIKSAKE
jgi:lipopolysaccharide assembly outer membrane protein LptD (OstA)